MTSSLANFMTVSSCSSACCSFALLGPITFNLTSLHPSRLFFLAPLIYPPKQGMLDCFIPCPVNLSRHGEQSFFHDSTDVDCPDCPGRNCQWRD
ncbi:hypothetical protein EV426DRAFT_619717 [Tirmania nivea]|nr:hypothetical protein EV426DRAFT_619717 [Tirmania nivea]